MFDTELYQQVLGLTAPWKVTDLRLASAVLPEISDDWETGRAYLTMEAR